MIFIFAGVRLALVCARNAREIASVLQEGSARHGTVRKHVSQYVVDAAALMTIDTNRPDIEAVHEVKALILESVIA